MGDLDGDGSLGLTPASLPTLGDGLSVVADVDWTLEPLPPIDREHSYGRPRGHVEQNVEDVALGDGDDSGGLT